MKIALSEKLVVNDYFTFPYAGNKTFVIIFLDEVFTLSDVEYPLVTSLIYIEEEMEDVILYTKCPNIIGIGNNFIHITSKDKSVLNKPLTIHNMSKCQVELYE